MIERALADQGPMTRFQLRDHLDAAGIRTAGQAFIHLVMLACLRGIAVRGPMVGKQHAYVLVRDWLGEPRPVDRDRALAELARRYLAGHGPASDRDLAKWAGLPLRDARAGLAAIGSELEDAGDGAVRLRGRRRSLDPDAAAAAARRLRPDAAGLVLARGDRRRPRIADRQRRGLQALRAGRRPRGGDLEVGRRGGPARAFDEISAARRQALEREAADVARFLSA